MHGLRFVIGVVCLSMTPLGAGCKKGTDSVTGPSASSLSGMWIGTLSRPPGFGSIAVRFEATQSGRQFSGPVMFTSGNVSLRGRFEGSLSGGGDSMAWSFQVSGQDPSLPNCNFKSGGTGASASNLSDGSRTITTTTFEMQYFGCQGFVDPNPFLNFRYENAQVALTKQ